MAHEKNTVSKVTAADCMRPPNGPLSSYFPNVVVFTHENRRALFYDDLLRGKTVLVNFMSIKDEATYRVTENLAKVQTHLGARLGRDVFMYSITVDPDRDTPLALAKFAASHKAQPGWLFLTGTLEVIETLRGRFFASGPAHAAHHHSAADEDCSMGMIRYGNEAVGLWGSVPSATQPEDIAMRVSWVEIRERPTGPPRRKGPPPLDLAG